MKYCANGGRYARHCKVALRKQVLPRLYRPGPVLPTLTQDINERIFDSGKRPFSGAGNPVAAAPASRASDFLELEPEARPLLLLLLLLLLIGVEREMKPFWGLRALWNSIRRRCPPGAMLLPLIPLLPCPWPCSSRLKPRTLSAPPFLPAPPPLPFPCCMFYGEKRGPGC